MEEIIRFVLLARSGRFTLTELCEQFGINRKTAYKHLERYAEAGLKCASRGVPPCARSRPDRVWICAGGAVAIGDRLRSAGGPVLMEAFSS